MRTWANRDKSEWGDGPWLAEPDKAQWIDEDTGLDCMVLRNHLGVWCGYVGVPTSHPLHGEHYNDAPESFVVHGGLTFSDSCQEPTEEAYRRARERARDPELKTQAAAFPDGNDYARAIVEYEKALTMSFEEWRDDQMGRKICHTVQPGRPDDVWWFGFDCGHGGDFIPAFLTLGSKLRKLDASTKFGPLYEEPLPFIGETDVYRTFDYVRQECADLARQLADAALTPRER